MVMLIFCWFGCGATQNLQEDWDKLTPVEQGRVVTHGLQDQLKVWYDAGQAFVLAHPQYKDEWHNKVNPLFDVANKAVKDALIYQKTPSDIYNQVTPTVAAVVSALTAWGVILPPATQ